MLSLLTLMVRPFPPGPHIQVDVYILIQSPRNSPGRCVPLQPFATGGGRCSLPWPSHSDISSGRSPHDLGGDFPPLKPAALRLVRPVPDHFPPWEGLSLLRLPLRESVFIGLGQILKYLPVFPFFAEVPRPVGFSSISPPPKVASAAFTLFRPWIQPTVFHPIPPRYVHVRSSFWRGVLDVFPAWDSSV